MQSSKLRVLVLRRTNYGESDRIVQLLTSEGQKVSAIARGVRKEKSKMAGAVELLCVSDITLHKGKGDLDILTSARLVTFFKDILHDYDKLQFAYEVLKKTSKLSEHVHEPSLFDCLHTTLEALNQQSIDIRIVRAWFYLQTAELSGHAINLSRDVNNQPLTPEETYRFDIDEMSFVQDKKGSFGSESLKLLKILTIKKPNIVAHISGTKDYLDDIVNLTHAIAE